MCEKAGLILAYFGGICSYSKLFIGWLQCYSMTELKIWVTSMRELEKGKFYNPSAKIKCLKFGFAVFVTLETLVLVFFMGLCGEKFGSIDGKGAKSE